MQIEYITDSARIVWLLPAWMLPTNDGDSIAKSITEALNEAKKDNSDAIERTEHNLRTQMATTRKQMLATREELSEMKALLQKVAEKVGAS